MLVESIIDPAQEDITLINTAKKFNSSVGQCVIGLSFQLPEHKQAFESRVLANNYKFVELAANDPLLKILL